MIIRGRKPRRSPVLSIPRVSHLMRQQIAVHIRQRPVVERQKGVQEALDRAEELRQKCPEWSKRNRIDGDIRLLERGESPYPKL